MRSRAALLALLVLAPLTAWAALPLVSSGRGATLGQLQHRIDRTRGKIERKRSQEGVLTTDIQAASDRIAALQRDISVLQRRQDTIQADLDVKRAQLLRIQGALRRERARLARLRARLARSRAVLAQRLRQIYEVQPPDVVTVILDSKGFADLLERGEFMRRINRQDVQVIDEVKTAKEAAKRASDRLAVLERRQRAITTAILVRRNQVASVRLGLVDKRSAYARARAAKAQTLRSVRQEREHLEEDLRAEQAQQARIQGVLAGGGSGGPIRHGSGRLIWPVNGPITSPFCERRAWEACHPGVDIGASSGTPIHAADSGTVKIAGAFGGYGNYTCIQHSGSLSTCYAHQSSIQVGVGQSVSHGQVIGLTGCTGLCFGPHLHFEVRVNGAVVNPLDYL
jgi:murein DD-endopeptidase MepM/ murein hydrolase activator NlpD